MNRNERRAKVKLMRALDRLAVSAAADGKAAWLADQRLASATPDALVLHFAADARWDDARRELAERAVVHAVCLLRVGQMRLTEEERHYFLLRAEQESGRLMMDMAFEVHAHCAAQLAAGSEDPAEGPEA